MKQTVLVWEERLLQYETDSSSLEKGCCKMKLTVLVWGKSCCNMKLTVLVMKKVAAVLTDLVLKESVAAIYKLMKVVRLKRIIQF